MYNLNLKQQQNRNDHKTAVPTAPPPPENAPPQRAENVLQSQNAAQHVASNPVHPVGLDSQISLFLSKLLREMADDIHHFPADFPHIMYVECMRTILTRVPLDMRKDHPEFDRFAENVIKTAENLLSGLRRKQVHTKGHRTATEDGGEELDVELDKTQLVLDNKYHEQYSKHSGTELDVEFKESSV